MHFSFKIIEKEKISTIIPLVYKLNEGKISMDVLEKRFKEIIHQNYECAGVFDAEKLIGISGMWFCTRHYSGKSMEVDHVYIDDSYRNHGLGKQFMQWITDYVKNKGVETMELNAYIKNDASHRFYHNLGFKKPGYHFLKKI
ncbi:GNAT family N-acetyltransferase [Oceanihabitans sp. 2_MG-2023]|uniref:GNAT family N-acetyltransferase n=1 Tax=Oceanihabitans sp. 2_MG-2023 TaxID=3062661 RepID=UPI0026E20B77|nr:GNAT family N-acetyltransferase [Oceanihabitans sp. 2_MG-2023]MDO6598407.1 GNAT family N-acetyltransferase [Oceanihabitans sp. 2_MG-2023]